jgi:hypothetical protein
LKDKLAAFEQKSNNRFELAARFINTVKQAEIIAQQENPEQGQDFLKKIGSNFHLSGQKLFLDFKNALESPCRSRIPPLAGRANNCLKFEF